MQPVQYMPVASKQGKAKTSQESWIWMARLLNAPKSANKDSTPVKAKAKDPQETYIHPSSLLRTRYLLV
jgi:hypothetical protein